MKLHIPLFLILLFNVMLCSNYRYNGDNVPNSNSSAVFYRVTSVRSESVGRSYDFFEMILSIIQAGLSMIFGRDGRGGSHSRRKGKTKVSYRNYQVLRVRPKTMVEVEDLRSMVEDVDLNFWTRPALKMPTDMLVPPDSMDDAREFLRDKGLVTEVLISDVQDLIAYENPKMTTDQRDLLNGRQGHPFTWSRYHRYADMVRYMEFLVYKYPRLVEIITIGYSTSGLPIKVVKISSEYNADLEPGESKPAIWIDGGIHGREWITSSVVMYIVRQLVEKYEKNRRLVDHADWFLLPVANPDGYEYSHTTDRLWAKTRSDHANSDLAVNLVYGACMGVNLDRNFDFHWGETGSSDEPCSDMYAGPRPYSEPESRAIADFIMEKSDQLQLYLTLRAYSQRWAMPWRFSDKKTNTDHNDMMNMAKKAADAMSKVSGTHFDIGSSSNQDAPSSGAADDWAKGAAKIKYSYKVHLRDKGSYGYLLPATQILPTARETFVGIKAIARSIVCKS